MQVFRIDSINKNKVTNESGMIVPLGTYLPTNAETHSYNNRYGFEMNDYEIKYHILVLRILKQFIATSKDSWCLIYEKGVKIIESVDAIQKSLQNAPKKTDVFFPYDKSEDIKRDTGLKISGSRFDTFWGSYIFFVSKAGAKKILANTKIDLPIDEFLLELSFTGRLSTNFAETNWFKFNERKSKCYKARRRAVNTAVFNSEAWKADEKAQALGLLFKLVEHADSLGIKLMLHAGTLLGGVRHGGIMPWDDDIDISISSADVEAFNHSIKKEGIIQITKWRYKKTGSMYYKYWLEGGEKVEGYPYAFPFIDFWIVYPKDGSQIKMTDGYVFDKKDYYPGQPIYFEGVQLYTPHKPMVVLDEMYKTWRNEIKVFTWCHRLKQPAFKPLRLEIEVDKNGKMI